MPNLPADYRAACSSQFDLQKQQSLETLLGLCSWQSLPIIAAPLSAIKQGPTRASVSPVDRTRVRLERCSPAPASATESTWEFHRIGPFNTTGGYDWTSVALPALPSERASRQGRPSEARVAVAEYALGSVSTAGRLLPYPPIHQHHFHVEESGSAVFAGALITHGDDQCLAAEGGVACIVRRLPPGYAQLLHTPLSVNVDVNDVRAANSAPRTHWLLIAVRGTSLTAADHRLDSSARVAALRPLTQLRLVVEPLDPRRGYPHTYLVPPGETGVFYASGEFAVDGQLVWSYLHTHPFWVDEMSLLVNASAAALDLGGQPLNVQRTWRAIGAGQLPAFRQALVARARAARATRVCHFLRSSSQAEFVAGTAELAGTFYRKSMGCAPFHLRKGGPFVAVIVTAPAMPQAAAAALAPVHTFFRLFGSFPGVTNGPTCAGVGCLEYDIP